MKEDAGKFLEANNKIFMAKSYIEECKNVINNLDFDVPESSDFQIAKEKIIDCDIAKVTTQIDEILMTLIAADGEFANEYLALLQEQREKYADSNIVFWKETSEREFLAMYAAMLAEADARGALSEEGKQQLALIRKQMDIYHVQDELNSTKMASEEYKNLTNEYFNNYAELIRMQPNLTDEEKREMLRNLRDQRTYQLNKIDINIEITDNAEKLEGMDPDSEQYYRTQENIFKLQQDATDLDIEWYNKIYESAVASGDYVTQERCANIISDLRAQNRQLQDKIDLNSMYIQKINLDKEYNEANAEDAYLIDAQRRQLDLDILQQKKDMGIATDAEKEYLEMSPLGRAWENTKAFTISTFLSVGRAGESIMDSVAMLGGNAEFVKTSIVDDAYSGLVAAGVINEVAAYGDAYEIGNTIGTMGGYVALSLLPGGPLVTTTVGALAAAGSAEQMALQRGATYEEALGTGAVAFALGGLSGYGLGALNAAAVGTTTAGQVALHTLAGGGIAALEPLGNSVAEYLIYGHDMMGEDASWWDYFKETGGPTNVLMAFGIGAASSGITSARELRINEEIMDTYKGIFADLPANKARRGMAEFRRSATVKTEAEFIAYAKKLGYSDDVIDGYLKQVKSELPRPEECPKAEWDSMSEVDRKNWFIVNNKTEAYYAQLEAKLGVASKNMSLIKLKSVHGDYDISFNDVLKAKVGAKTSTFIDAKKVVGSSGVDYSSSFPKFDYFISDEAAYRYTLEITGISEENIATYYGKALTPENKIDALGWYLRTHPQEIKTIRFYNADPNVCSLTKYNSTGRPGGTYLDGTEHGGQYITFTLPEELAAKYPQYCKMEDGKFVITDYQKFGEDVLGGVELSNSHGAYMATFTTPLEEVSMPSVNNQGMYSAEGLPGGYLINGYDPEGVLATINIEKEVVKGADGYILDFSHRYGNVDMELIKLK